MHAFFDRTLGTDCLGMGGIPGSDDGDWGLCKLDFCYSKKPKHTIYAPMTDEACPAHARFEISIDLPNT